MPKYLTYVAIFQDMFIDQIMHLANLLKITVSIEIKFIVEGPL